MSSTSDAKDQIRDIAQSGFALGLLFVLGFTLIILGTRVNLDPWGRVVTAVGGVLFGSGLSMLINRIYAAPNPLSTVLRLINDMVSVPWRTNESELRPLRRRYHGYLSTLRAGERLWLYREFDFGTIETPGHLDAIVQYPVDQRMSRYRYYGVPVMRRLVLIGLNANVPNEEAVVHIFPSCGAGGTVIHAGLAFLQPPGNGPQIVTPTLLSDEPLIAHAVPGPVPADQAQLLDQRWKQEFGSTLNLPHA